MRPSPWTLLATVLSLAAAAGAQDWQGRARIDGRVTGEDQAPLAGARVSVDRLSGGPGPRLESDAHGRWAVDGIASGSWMIVVEAFGYRAARVGVHLPGESSWLAPVEVRLEKARAPRAPLPPDHDVTPSAERTVPGAGREDRPPASLVDVRTALETGRVEQARALASSLQWDEGGSADGLFEVGAAFLAAGATTEAAAFLEVAIAADPGRVEAHYRRALTLLVLGRQDEARRDFETVLTLSPGGELAAKAQRALDVLAPGSAE